MGGVDKVLNIKQSRSRCVVDPISLKLWIHEWGKYPNIVAGGPEGVLENSQNVGIKLAVPTWIATKLRWEDEYAAVGAIIEVPALLDP
jgi:hypothetical protein